MAVEPARVATNIRMIAEGRGMTLPDLWTKIGLSKQVFYKRLNGTSKWKAADLAAVAEALDVRVDVLLSDPAALLERMRAWVTAEPDQTIRAAA